MQGQTSLAKTWQQRTGHGGGIQQCQKRVEEALHPGRRWRPKWVACRKHHWRRRGIGFCIHCCCRTGRFLVSSQGAGGHRGSEAIELHTFPIRWKHQASRTSQWKHQVRSKKTRAIGSCVMGQRRRQLSVGTWIVEGEGSTLPHVGCKDTIGPPSLWAGCSTTNTGVKNGRS